MTRWFVIFLSSLIIVIGVRYVTYSPLPEAVFTDCQTPMVENKLHGLWELDRIDNYEAFHSASNNIEGGFLSKLEVLIYPLILERSQLYRIEQCGDEIALTVNYLRAWLIASAEVEKPKEVNVTPQRKEATPQSDPKAEMWATKNPWFGNDTAMTYTAFDLHKTLVEQEGYDPKSDEYYEEIDKRIRVEFPHKFDKVEDTTTERVKPTQNVASAKRSASTGRRKTVKLTPSQVAIAKRLGVPLEDYAKQLKITEGA